MLFSHGKKIHLNIKNSKPILLDHLKHFIGQNHSLIIKMIFIKKIMPHKEHFLLQNNYRRPDLKELSKILIKNKKIQ